MSKVNLFFVPHTHWDREWYCSFEVFRKSFVELMKDFIQFLQNNKDFPPFTLDGQVSLIEDYLEIYPEDADKIKELVSSGNIRIGPWYSSLEPSILDSETIVRNLLIGNEMCRKWGNNMKIGYLPDSAGLISQIPQIMKLSNIPHIIFTRGLGDEIIFTEYLIRGADGTEITATYQIQAYNNAAYLPENPEELKDRIDAEVNKISCFSVTPWILMNQGGDHHHPQKNLPDLLKLLADSGEYNEIQVGGFDDYYNKIKDLLPEKLYIINNELRHSKYYPILSGIFSARIDMKLKNAYLENRITRFLEPLGVMAMLCNDLYPAVMMNRLWKLILLNHHHDTIGGTVSDVVYREAMVRYEKAEDLINILSKDFINIYSGDMQNFKNGHPVLVVNTHTSLRSDIVKIKWITQESKGKSISIIDENGNKVPSQILEYKQLERAYPFFSRKPLHEIEMIFQALDVPPLSHKLYYIREMEEENIKTEFKNTIKNEFFEVGPEPYGSFYIKELDSGKIWTGINGFRDEADCGDLYNFSFLPGDILLNNCIKNFKVTILPGELQETLIISGNLSLPEALDKNRTGRSSKLILNPFELCVKLYKDIPLVDCTLKLENLSEDHRLRMVFPCLFYKKMVRIGQPFDFMERCTDIPKADGWIEKPSPTRNFKDIIDISSPDGSLAIFTEGLEEYEIKGAELILTLVRSAGWLSREDNSYRKVETAPKIQVPEGQCRKNLIFNYGIMPHKGENDLNTVFSLWQRYRNPLTGFVGFYPGSSSQPLLVKLEPDYLVVTACKKSGNGNNMILRFYNPMDYHVEAKINSGNVFNLCRRVNLLEEPLEKEVKLPLTMTVNSKEIVTIELCSGV